MTDVTVTPEERGKFIKEQYTQYYHMMRMHLAFSWQIPSLVIVATLLFLSLEARNFVTWIDNPIWPSIGFIVLSLFLLVMFIHHRRNVYFANYYDEVLMAIERKYGEEFGGHHTIGAKKIRGVDKISSSNALSVFLIALISACMVVGIYFLYLTINIIRN